MTTDAEFSSRSGVGRDGSCRCLPDQAIKSGWKRDTSCLIHVYSYRYELRDARHQPLISSYDSYRPLWVGRGSVAVPRCPSFLPKSPFGRWRSVRAILCRPVGATQSGLRIHFLPHRIVQTRTEPYISASSRFQDSCQGSAGSSPERV